MNCADDRETKQLVESHLEYAYALAKQFTTEVFVGNIDYEDIRATAILGLCDAARRYDPQNGVLFKTFSYFRIRGAMFDLVRRSNQLIKCEREYFLDLPAPEAKTPDKEANENQEISTSYAKNREELEKLKEFVICFYRNTESHREGEIALSDAIDSGNAEKSLIWQDTIDYIYRLTQSLPKNERNILQMHYFEGFSFPEIRQIYANVSRSWISRMHVRGLDRLRDLVVAEEKRGVAIEHF